MIIMIIMMMMKMMMMMMMMTIMLNASFVYTKFRLNCQYHYSIGCC